MSTLPKWPASGWIGKKAGRLSATLLLAIAAVLSTGCALHGWTSPQQLAAFEAVRDGDSQALERALDAGAPADATHQETGRSLLHFAAIHGHPAITAQLIERGTPTDTVDASGRLPLHYAAEGEHSAVALQLLDTARRSDLGDREGRTPLMIAARGGHLDLVNALLEADADPDRRDDSGATALSLAAGASHPATVERLRAVSRQPASPAAVAPVVRAHDVETLAWMIERGLDIWGEWREDGARTTLAEVALASSPHAAALLLRYGATAEQRAGGALAAATLHGDLDRVRTLLDAGADPNGVVAGADTAERTLLMEAARLGRTEIARALLAAGADPSQRDAHGADALWHAAVGHTTRRDAAAEIERLDDRDSTLRALLEAGLRPSGGDRYGFAAVHAVAAWGAAETLAALLDAGAGAEQSDRNGRTPLIFAAQHGQTENVTLLLERGADPRAADRIGATALTYARLAAKMGGDRQLARQIRDAGGAKRPGPQRGTPLLSVRLDERRMMRLDQAVAIYDSAEQEGHRGRLLPYTTTCLHHSCLYPAVVVLPPGTTVERLHLTATEEGRRHSVYLVQEPGLRGLLFEDFLFGGWPPAGAATSELTLGRIAHIRSMEWVEAFDVDLSAATGGLFW